jgi:O-antigen ligase
MSSATRRRKLNEGSDHTFESALNHTLRILVISRILVDGLSTKFFFVDVITGLIIVWLGVQELVLKRKSEHLSGKATLIPFYLFLVVSSIYGYTRDGVDFSAFLFQASFLLLFLLCRFVLRMSFTERIKFRNGLILVLTISAALGLFELIFGRTPLTQSLQVLRAERFSGFILWPNMASILYGIALCGVLVSSKRISIKVLFSVILFGGVLATSTLTGTVATLLGLFWILRRNYLVFVSLLAFGYLLSTYSGIRLNIVDRFFSLSVPSIEVVQSQRSTDSATWRVIQWQRVLSVVKENIFFGIGFGRSENSAKIGGYLPHSDYFRILLETGVVGAIVFLIAAKSLLRKLFPKEMLVKSPLTLACLTIIAVSSFTENLLGQTAIFLIVPFFIINTEKGV